jgi:hypothetical protein
MWEKKLSVSIAADTLAFYETKGGGSAISATFFAEDRIIGKRQLTNRCLDNVEVTTGIMRGTAGQVNVEFKSHEPCS